MESISAKEGPRLGNCFLHPNFWSPQKYCDFIVVINNHMKSDKNDNFKESLNQNALEQKILGPEGNWAVTLGESDFRKLYFSNVGGEMQVEISQLDWTHFPKHTQVTILIALICEKFEHKNDIIDKVQKEFNWNGEDWITHYAQYWITRFPNLATFLWNEFVEFRCNGHFTGFYSLVDQSVSSLPLESEQLMKETDSELIEDLHAGGLTEKFVCEHLTIEFRTLDAIQLEAVLPLGCVTMMVGPDKIKTGVRVIWDMKLVPSIQYSCTEAISKTETMYVVTTKASEAAAFVVKQTENLGASFSLNGEASRFTKPSKIVIITESMSEEDKLKTSKQICNSLNYQQISWKDLDMKFEKIQDRFVVMKDVRIQLSNILPNSDRVRNTILNKLQGQELISLLRNQSPKVFAKCEPLCSLPEVYISRDYKKVYEFSFQKLAKLGTQQDMFVVKNETSDNLSTDQCFVIKETEEEFRHAINNRTKNEYHNNNVHFLTYTGSDTCIWRHTAGSTEIFEQYNKMYPPAKLTEEQLTQQITNQRMVVFTGRAGEGKSVATLKASFKSERHLTVFLRGRDLIYQLNDGCFMKEELLGLVLNIICGTEFEKKLLTWNLHTKETKFKVLMVLDGYDELDKYERQLLLTFLDFIWQDLPSVKILVSAGSHVDYEIQKRFDARFYTMESFSIANKIEYLTKHWKRCLEMKVTAQKYTETELEELAKKCCNLQIVRDLDVLGIPLVISMLATVVEKKLSKFNFPKLQSISDLYAEFVKRKIEQYLQEKERVENFDTEKPYWKVVYDDICQRHVYYALKLVVGDEASYWFKEAFQKCDSDEKYVLDLGLIENIENLRFKHRTIAEYFVALFFANVANGDWDKILISDPSYQQILWNQLLNVNEKYETFEYPVFCEFFNAMLPNTLSIKEAPKEFRDLLENLVDYKYFQSDYVYENHLEWNFWPILKSFMKLCSRRYDRITYFGQFFEFTVGALFGVALVFHKFNFWKFAIEQLSGPFLQDLRFGHTVVGSKFQNEIEDDLTVLHVMFSQIMNHHPDRHNICFINLLEFVAYLRGNNINVVKVHLESVSSFGRTPLAYFVGQSCYENPETLKCVKWLVEDLNADIFTVDNAENTLLHQMANAMCLIARKRKMISDTQVKIYASVWKYLLDKGLDCAAKNMKRKNPFDILLIEAQNNPNIKEILGILQNRDEVRNFKTDKPL